MELKAYLKNKQKLVDKYLDQYSKGNNNVPELSKAVRYSLLAPGKRLRPVLVLAVADLFNCPKEKVLPVACAIEMIHVYSLIHDDLPAMDDDDLRRGKPTNHRVFGEGMAILAGDTLQAEAFRLIVRKSDSTLGAKKIITVIDELSEACGLAGMAAGQALDLQAENKKIKLTALRKVHALKTGKLLRCAVRVGAIIAGAKPKELKALSQYAESLGIAFQVQDDLLDVIGDTKTLGKRRGSDQRRGKSTYPALLGIEKTKKLLEQEVNKAKKALSIFNKKAELLRQLVDYVKERSN